MTAWRMRVGMELSVGNVVLWVMRMRPAERPRHPGGRALVITSCDRSILARGEQVHTDQHGWPLLAVFFHQCEVRSSPGRTSPAWLTIGTAALLAYSRPTSRKRCRSSVRTLVCCAMARCRRVASLVDAAGIGGLFSAIRLLARSGAVATTSGDAARHQRTGLLTLAVATRPPWAGHPPGERGRWRARPSAATTARRWRARLTSRGGRGKWCFMRCNPLRLFDK